MVKYLKTSTNFWVNLKKIKINGRSENNKNKVSNYIQNYNKKYQWDWNSKENAMQ